MIVHACTHIYICLYSLFGARKKEQIGESTQQHETCNLVADLVSSFSLLRSCIFRMQEAAYKSAYTKEREKELDKTIKSEKENGKRVSGAGRGQRRSIENEITFIINATQS